MRVFPSSAVVCRVLQQSCEREQRPAGSARSGSSAPAAAARRTGPPVRPGAESAGRGGAATPRRAPPRLRAQLRTCGGTWGRPAPPRAPAAFKRLYAVFVSRAARAARHPARSPDPAPPPRPPAILFQRTGKQHRDRPECDHSAAALSLSCLRSLFFILL